MPASFNGYQFEHNPLSTQLESFNDEMCIAKEAHTSVESVIKTKVG